MRIPSDTPREPTKKPRAGGKIAHIVGTVGLSASAILSLPTHAQREMVDGVSLYDRAMWWLSHIRSWVEKKLSLEKEGENQKTEATVESVEERARKAEELAAKKYTAAIKTLVYGLGEEAHENGTGSEVETLLSSPEWCYQWMGALEKKFHDNELQDPRWKAALNALFGETMGAEVIRQNRLKDPQKYPDNLTLRATLTRMADDFALVEVLQSIDVTDFSDADQLAGKVFWSGENGERPFIEKRAEATGLTPRSIEYILVDKREFLLRENTGTKDILKNLIGAPIGKDWDAVISTIDFWQRIQREYVSNPIWHLGHQDLFIEAFEKKPLTLWEAWEIQLLMGGKEISEMSWTERILVRVALIGLLKSRWMHYEKWVYGSDVFESNVLSGIFWGWANASDLTAEEKQIIERGLSRLKESWIDTAEDSVDTIAGVIASHPLIVCLILWGFLVLPWPKTELGYTKMRRWGQVTARALQRKSTPTRKDADL